MTGDERRTKAQLLDELRVLRKQLSEQSQRGAPEKEGLLHATLESTADGILAVDAAGKVIFANRQFAQMWRIPPDLFESGDDEELLQFVLDQLVDPEGFLQKVQELYQSFRDDLDMLHFRDGRVFERFSRPLAQDGAVAGRVWSFRDVTEQKRVEEALRASEELERQFNVRLTNMHGVLNELSRASSTEELCRQAVLLGCQDLGFDRLSVWLTDISTQEHRGTFGIDEQGELRDERDRRFTVVPDSDFGRMVSEGRRYYISKAMPLMDDRGNVVGHGDHATAGLWDGEKVTGHIAMDNLFSGAPITEHDCELLILYAYGVGHLYERKRAEEQLREGQTRLRELFDNAPVGYHELDTTGRITRINKTECTLLGYTEEEMVGRAVWEFTEQPDEVRQVVQSKLEDHAPPGHTFERVYRCRDGTSLTLLIEDRLLRDPAGDITGLRSTVQDVSDRRRAEEAVRESEQLYRTLVESSPVGIWQDDAQGRIVYSNPAMCALLGIKNPEDLSGENWRRFFTPESLAAIDRENAGRQQGLSSGYEVELVGQDGIHHDVIVHGAPLMGKDGSVAGTLATFLDITERKRLEAQVRHAQKLESLGVLAGGIAHDFNNLLVGILGAAELALEHLPDTSPARDWVERIAQTSHQAADLAHQMLAYSGRGKLAVQPIDLTGVIKEMGPLIGAAVSKKATLDLDLDERLPTLQGDAAQIRQVVLNLVTNASEALGDEVGTITIATGSRIFTRSDLRSTYADGQLPEGHYITLEVTDTGRGMEEEIVEKVFDPFFSTKFAGRGLGLAALLGIVRGHGGGVQVETGPGHGATFRVLFPASDTALAAASAAATALPKAGSDEALTWRGSGTVLLVDDEEIVREVGTRVLRQLGFDVLTAANGVEALEVLQQHMDAIVCVLLDLTMPVMDGQQALREIHKISADVPVILCSGYSSEQLESHFSGQGLAATIHKPYHLATFAETLRTVLEGRS